MKKSICGSLLALSLLLSACGDDDEQRVYAPSITGPASIANGITGTAIPPTAITTTGTPPITFTVISGTLPPGITLDTATGTYAGTPTTMGSFNFTVAASNRAGNVTRDFSHTILQVPAISGPASPLAPSVAGNAPPAVNFTASGSTPVTWSVTAGSLPPGMSLNAATGAYTGTPTGVGNFSFTITATNAVGADSDSYTQSVTAPAFNAHALIGGNRIAAFATTFPAGLDAPLTLSGVNAGEAIVSIDRRPQNGFLYGLGFNPTAGSVQLYSISTTTGVATPIGATGSFVGADGTTPVPVGAGAATFFGIDFNPTVDRVRVVNSAGQNFRMNPNTGAFVDGSTAVANLNMDGAINGPTLSVQETAYTNSAPSTTVTTQYTLDVTTDALCIQNPPNNGTQTACQSIGAVDDVLGFDISPAVTVATSNTPASGSGTAVLRMQGGEVVASVNLANGALGPVSAIVSDGVRGLALQAPAAMPFVGLSADGTQIMRFTSAAPGSAVTVAVTGVAAGESLAGIDYRPQTGQLYGLGVNDTANNATLYLLDPQTGAATPVGAVGQVAFVDAGGGAVDLPSAASGYGFDFNPTVDRVRVVTNSGLNFRVNPNNGAPVDGNLNNAAMPPDNINTDGLISGLPVGSTGVSGAAYTNSFGQPLTGGVTTQYVLDSASDQLFFVNPPNSGVLAGGLGIKVNGALIDFTAVNGFDIPSDVRVMTSNTPAANGSGFAALMVGGTQMLYSVELSTGVTTSLGALAMPIAGLAAGQVAVK